MAILNMLAVLCVWAVSTYCVAGAAKKYLVDLSGPGCDNLDGYYLQDMDDMATVYALPQYNAMATRDHCDVTIRADSNRRIQYLIDIIKFNECGIEIYIYDNPTIDANPLHLIRCADNSRAPIYGKSRFNVLRIRVRKTTPQSRVFEFSMKLKNDLGPTLEFENTAAQYAGETLEPGVIAGIGVAGAILVIALILIAIWLCIRGRNANQDKDGASSTKGESSVYTSGRVELPTSEPHKPSSPTIQVDIKREESMAQWRTSEVQAPRRTRRMEPTKTMPTPRDPTRRGLSDRHRSGDRAARPDSQTRRTRRM